MPKFSVYTPTHNPKWLRDCYVSLQGQTLRDWEWVVLKNGKPFSLPTELTVDARVKVFDTKSTGIGALKREAVARCIGEVFVELDHDDMLARTCLEDLAEVGRMTPGGFYYSDFANFFSNGAPETYPSSNGWEQYPETINGVDRVCQRAFPAVPRSLAEIWYAPNHVRAWSRSAYGKSGGYDATMAVGDDHDLICRTYLSGVPFVHVEKPLYVYRKIDSATDANTHIKQQDEIVKASYRNMNRYLHRLVIEWCRRRGLPCLDLGNLQDCPEGFQPNEFGLDPIGFLNMLGPSSVGCLRAYDVVQYLPREAFVTFMNSAYQALTAGGFFLSATPSTDGRGAYQNPAHTNFINQNTWSYFTQRGFARYLPGMEARFQSVRVWSEAPGDANKASLTVYSYADLLALKGFKHIGPISI